MRARGSIEGFGMLVEKPCSFFDAIFNKLVSMFS
jgi:hypothetical protein